MANAQLANVHVDFNDMDVEGRFITLPGDADRLLALGEQVVLADAEGNRAQGLVVDLQQRGRAIVEMVSGTWRGAPVANASGVDLRDQLAVMLSALHGMQHSWYTAQEVASESAPMSADPALAGPRTRSAVPSSV